MVDARRNDYWEGSKKHDGSVRWSQEIRCAKVFGLGHREYWCEGISWGTEIEGVELLGVTKVWEQGMRSSWKPRTVRRGTQGFVCCACGGDSSTLWGKWGQSVTDAIYHNTRSCTKRCWKYNLCAPFSVFAIFAFFGIFCIFLNGRHVFTTGCGQSLILKVHVRHRLISMVSVGCDFKWGCVLWLCSLSIHVILIFFYCGRRFIGFIMVCGWFLIMLLLLIWLLRCLGLCGWICCSVDWWHGWGAVD